MQHRWSLTGSRSRGIDRAWCRDTWSRIFKRRDLGFFCHHSYWEFVLSFFWSLLTWRRKVKLRFTSWLCCSFEEQRSCSKLNWKSETTQRTKRKRHHAARILIKHGWSSLDGTAGNRISAKSKMWCILNLICSYCSHWKLTVFSSETQKGSERAANESA